MFVFVVLCRRAPIDPFKAPTWGRTSGINRPPFPRDIDCTVSTIESRPTTCMLALARPERGGCQNLVLSSLEVYFRFFCERQLNLWGYRELLENAIHSSTLQRHDVLLPSDFGLPKEAASGSFVVTRGSDRHSRLAYTIRADLMHSPAHPSMSQRQPNVQ